MHLVCAILAAALTIAVALLVIARNRQRELELAKLELLRVLDEARQREATLAEKIQTLSREHDLIRALMDNVPDWIYFKDLQCRFMMISREVAGVLGVKSPEDAVGKTDFDFFREADAQAFRNDDEAVMQSGKPLVDRIEKAEVKGATKWMSTTKAPVFDAQGKVVGLVGISRDITERKKVEAELEHERYLLNALLDNMPDEIYFKDEKLRFLKANHAVCSALKSNDVIGKTDFDFFEAKDASVYAAREQVVLSTGKPIIDYIHESRGHDKQAWISITKVPIRDKSGSFVGLVGINRDVTARKQAEDLLRDIIARAECVLWHADVTDNGQKLEWDFKMLSPESIRRWLGLDVDASNYGQVWSSHVNPEHLKEMNERSLNALRGGQSGYRQEFEMRGVDGTPRWMAETVGITSKGPGSWQLIGVVFDITERKRYEEALRDSEFKLRQVLDTNPNLIMVRDPEGKLVLANAALADFYQTPLGAVVGVRHTELHTKQGGNPEESDFWRTTDREILQSGQPQQLMTRATGPSGRQHWFRTKKLPLTLPNGVKAVLVICEDITDLKQAEQELAKERDLLQALMDNVPDNIYFKDLESRFIRINTYQAYNIGLTNPADAVGKSDFDFHPADRAKEFFQDEREVLSGRRIIGKVERFNGEGTQERWTLTSKVPFYGRNGEVTGIVGVSKDITHLKRMEQQLAEANEQLNKLAREDALTGLLNRRMMLELADTEWARWQRYGKTFSVMVIDADDFKVINDTFGHQAGDLALKHLSDRLSEAIRAVDIIGRYGGEEFVIILPETSSEGAVSAAEKALQNVRNAPVDVNGDLIHITVSIGIASVKREDKNIDMLLHRADSALYTAKHNGKNQLAVAET